MQRQFLESNYYVSDASGNLVGSVDANGVKTGSAEYGHDGQALTNPVGHMAGVDLGFGAGGQRGVVTERGAGNLMFPSMAGGRGYSPQTGQRTQNWGTGQGNGFGYQAGEGDEDFDENQSSMQFYGKALHPVSSALKGIMEFALEMNPAEMLRQGLQGTGLWGKPLSAGQRLTTLGGMAAGPIFGNIGRGGKAVIHLTNPVAKAAIEASGKIGGKWGIFALQADKVPKSPLMRTAKTLVGGDLSAEVEITGEALAHFRSPKPFGLISGLRRAAGVTSTPLGSVNIKTGAFTKNEVFVNGQFRQASRTQIAKYYGHQFMLDYGIDGIIYGWAGCYYWLNKQGEE